ncbi:hypothetical protein ACPC54_18250 [Kitasatospora sp. NPDC094028]
MDQNTTDREHWEQRHLGRYGLLRFTATTNTTTGVRTYTLTGPHVRGCVTLLPGTTRRDPTEPASRCPWRTEPDLLIAYGAGDSRRLGPEDSPLTVNGIRLTDVTHLSYADLDESGVIPVWRLNEVGNPVPLPPATDQHAQAVVRAVVQHHRAQPDLAALEHAARLAAAPHWLTHHGEALARLEGSLARIVDERDSTAERVLQLHTLLADSGAAVCAA